MKRCGFVVGKFGLNPRYCGKANPDILYIEEERFIWDEFGGIQLHATKTITAYLCPEHKEQVEKEFVS